MSKQNPSLQFLKTAILKVLKSNPDSLNHKQISWALNLKGSEYQKVMSQSIKMLKKENLIIESEKYKYRHNTIQKVISGVIDINTAGHGYVNSDAYELDVFITRKRLSTALNGDVVSIKILKSNQHKLTGEVVEVLKRANSKFIGIIENTNTDAFFIPDNIKTGSHFFIPHRKLNGAKHNDRVIVKFTDWPLSAKNPLGSVLSILPKKHTLKTEIKSNIEIFNIRHVFSKKIQDELNDIDANIDAKSLKTRKDFRKYFTATIDPDDAKDFDDALSLKFLDSGIVEVGIHIADVGHYVPTNSEIDKEAFLRAFSVYFPGQVIPMLPEKLSNQICSLSPNEDKLCFSVVVGFKKDLKTIHSTWIGKTIINSNKRFTYKEAENLISGNSCGDFNSELTLLNDIAKNLRKKRIVNGSINFERSDICFELNNIQEPIKVTKKQSLATHKLVEEFMLLANKSVADKLSSSKQAIYRVHDLPDKNKLKELEVYLNQFKNSRFNFNINNQKLHKVINALLNASNLEVGKEVVENLILRAMAKAVYSTKNIGHYGLGFEKYTHFTSPIRRYADLITHRLLDNVLNNKKPPLIDLEKKCRYFSSTEKLYVSVERKTTKFIQLMLLEGSIGDTFSGAITGIAKWGIYVDVGDGQGEGLVSLRDLSGNYYYNDLKRSFVSRKSGKKYTLGQGVSVTIKSINLFKHEMDLVILK